MIYRIKVENHSYECVERAERFVACEDRAGRIKSSLLNGKTDFSMEWSILQQRTRPLNGQRASNRTHFRGAVSI